MDVLLSNFLAARTTRSGAFPGLSWECRKGIPTRTGHYSGRVGARPERGPGRAAAGAGSAGSGLAILCRYLVVCRCKRVVMRYTRNGTREQDAAGGRIPAWQANGPGRAGAGAPSRPRGVAASEDPPGPGRVDHHRAGPEPGRTLLGCVRGGGPRLRSGGDLAGAPVVGGVSIRRGLGPAGRRDRGRGRRPVQFRDRAAAAAALCGGGCLAPAAAVPSLCPLPDGGLDAALGPAAGPAGLVAGAQPAGDQLRDRLAAWPGRDRLADG